MIAKENYEKQHIMELHKSSKKDPQLLERALHAFGLLEAISRVGMPFIFKGGTCLMLLLKHPMRLSTDIDIIVAPGTPIEKYLEEAAKIFPFREQEEQVRIGKNRIEKRHFKFTYESPVTRKDIYILLDILFEESHYEALIEKEIKNELLLLEGEPLKVKIPSINCILGDKLTAFAPHTTGILLDTGKDMEVMKQMYDVCTLMEEFDDYQEMYKTYRRIAEQEIAYRGKTDTIEDVLKDTFRAAYCIASRGKVSAEEYPLYVKAIRSLRSHIYAENYSPEIAAVRAVKIMYITACMLNGRPFDKIEDSSLYEHENYIGDELKHLNYLRKINLEAYAYSIKTDRIMRIGKERDKMHDAIMAGKEQTDQGS